MNAVKRFLNNGDINRFRFWFQVAAFGLLIYGGFLAVDLGNSLPAFSCVFAESRAGACYLYPLQHQVNMPWAQFLGGRGVGFAVGLATFILFFILFNKAWCGYACPLGTVQDWVSKVRTALGIRFSLYSERTFRRLKGIKYLLLALLVLLPLGISNSLVGAPKLPHDLATAYCMICPGRTVLPIFTGDISQLAIDFSSKTMTVLTGLGMAITGIFFAGSFVKRRFFCLFCPMSALQYAFSKAGLLRLTKIGAKCTRCGNCSRVCDVGIREIADDVTSKNIVQDDCMMCFKCVAACPEEKCLTASFLGIPVYEATVEGFANRARRRNVHG
ncbi:MAG: 4Fe-4S binding protein [Nitrospirota bacterium]|nr:4Fe-4S binding protein [Nitrospirota bacterium]